MPWLKRSWVYLQLVVREPNPLWSWHLICYLLTFRKSFLSSFPCLSQEAEWKPKSMTKLLTRYLEQWQFPLCFCRHDDSSSISAQRNVNTVVLGFYFFFLSYVTNTCAAPYKQHLVLSLQPRIPGCPILPFKAAKQITNQADWDLEQTGLQKPRLLCPLMMLFPNKLMFPF